MSRPILFISADLPWPPDGGGRIASLRVLESFASKRPVDLLALADPIEPPDLQYLHSICRRVEIVRQPFTFGRHPVRQGLIALRSLALGQPYRLAKFRNRSLRALIAQKRADSQYELVHYEQLGVAPYADGRLPTTLTTQNVESELYRLGSRDAQTRVARTWAALEGRKLSRAEPKLWRRFDTVFVLSEHDAEILRRAGIRDTAVLPIPVDAPAEWPSSRPPRDPILLSLGSMSWFGVEDGLRWFYERVLPIIRQTVPRVRWDLVGPNAGPRIQAMSADGAITVRGYVRDIEPYIAGARVCLVPLHIAGGVRIKLLEFMARGRPAVATTIGAQGLAFTDGEGCFRRDEPHAFAQAVVALLQNDALWRRTSEAGWQYVRRVHTRSAMSDALELGIRSALRRHADRIA